MPEPQEMSIEQIQARMKDISESDENPFVGRSAEEMMKLIIALAVKIKEM